MISFVFLLFIFFLFFLHGNGSEIDGGQLACANEHSIFFSFFFSLFFFSQLYIYIYDCALLIGGSPRRDADRTMSFENYALPSPFTLSLSTSSLGMRASKSFRVSSARERSTLLEFMVAKRISFLQYLQEVHSDSGAFWMNVVQLNRRDVSAYFSQEGSGERGRSYPPSNAAPSHHNDPNASPSAATVPTPPAFSPKMRREESLMGTADSQKQYDRWPRYSKWQSHYLPSFLSLGVGLSELLAAPLPSEAFVESVFGLLLEVEAAFASGSSTKPAGGSKSAQEVWERLRAVAVKEEEDAAEASAKEAGEAALAPTSHFYLHARPEDRSASCVYRFLPYTAEPTAATHRQYSFSCTPRQLDYSKVVPSVCATLALLYRKLCDFEHVKDPCIVRRILAIDKLLVRLFFSRLTTALEAVAHRKLLTEASLLTDEPDGLFKEYRSEEQTAEGGITKPFFDFLDLLSLRNDNASHVVIEKGRSESEAGRGSSRERGEMDSDRSPSSSRCSFAEDEG